MVAVVPEAHLDPAVFQKEREHLLMCLSFRRRNPFPGGGGGPAARRPPARGACLGECVCVLGVGWALYCSQRMEGWRSR